MTYILLEYLTYVALATALGSLLFAATATAIIGQEGARRVALASRRLANQAACLVTERVAPRTRKMLHSSRRSAIRATQMIARRVAARRRLVTNWSQPVRQA